MNKPNEQSGYVGNTVTLSDIPPIPTSSAVSWGAIVAGAVATAALSLILLLLGTGLELSSVSPWAYGGVTATTFGVTTIIWITVSQLLASGMGGYLAGRLRTKWAAVHTKEVYFRDTAHGFLSWALAALVTATLLTSAIGSIIHNGALAGAVVAGGAATTTMAPAAIPISGIAQANAGQGSVAYLLDALFRKDAKALTNSRPIPGNSSQIGDSTQIAAGSEKASPIAEVARIFMNSLQAGALPAGDLRYVGQLVAQHTGLSQQNAEKRVKDIYGRIQTTLSNAETTALKAADTARKASAYAALWLFISLLAGAFVASLAATYGGRQRDR